jgi:hypothetical protein
MDDTDRFRKLSPRRAENLRIEPRRLPVEHPSPDTVSFA